MTKAAFSVLLVLALTATANAEKITKESVTSQGKERTYYLFVPDRVKDKPAPLIVLLHGSGRDGRILVEHWQSMAKKEGIILAGPDAIVRAGWGMSDDGPLLLRHVIEAVQTDYAVDRRRMYIFGHSAGAIHGIGMGVLESEYFAAVAVHAGAVSPSVVPYIARAPRKIPIAVWVGTNDSSFPLRQVRESLELLKRQEFDVELTEIKGHTHNYYGRSSEINSAAWTFLESKRLDKDPHYQDYVVGR
jgi:poly(3-hydroxybutyrate) depolymerase